MIFKMKPYSADSVDAMSIRPSGSPAFINARIARSGSNEASMLVLYAGKYWSKAAQIKANRSAVRSNPLKKNPG
jgi:hypothetical protein